LLPVLTTKGRHGPKLLARVPVPADKSLLIIKTIQATEALARIAKALRPTRASYICHTVICRLHELMRPTIQIGGSH
jgi:hypothetical protein